MRDPQPTRLGQLAGRVVCYLAVALLAVLGFGPWVAALLRWLGWV